MTVEWQTGRPPKHGYYLAAWQRGPVWTVSELWYNPDSTGSGWWASRGYLGEPDRGQQPIPVKAWTPIPEYPGAG